MSTYPTIDDAKALAYRHRQSAVAVLFFSGGKFGFSSYGVTRKQCAAMGKVMDQIHRLIENGTVMVPDVLTRREA